MKQFRNVISLGAFCFVASKLRRLNLRKQAYPFDWIITDIQTVMTLIENNFNDFCNEDLLVKKYGENGVFYDNLKYSLLRFVHDFNEDCTNTEEIKRKYSRRLNRFYSHINDNTLFIRYIIDKNEYKYILKNYGKLKKLLKSFNKNNEIIFILNDEIKVNHWVNLIKQITVYPVKKDEQDSVAKNFVEKNDKLKQMLKGIL